MKAGRQGVCGLREVTGLDREDSETVNVSEGSIYLRNNAQVLLIEWTWKVMEGEESGLAPRAVTGAPGWAVVLLLRENWCGEKELHLGHTAFSIFGTFNRGYRYC